MYIPYIVCRILKELNPIKYSISVKCNCPKDTCKMMVKTK